MLHQTVLVTLAFAAWLHQIPSQWVSLSSGYAHDRPRAAAHANAPMQHSQSTHQTFQQRFCLGYQYINHARHRRQWYYHLTQTNDR